MLNATPVHWHCKRESTVETTTFGSELVAAVTPVDQTIDLCLTLIYLDIPINPKSYMFGDKQGSGHQCHHSTIPKDSILLPTTEFSKQLQWLSPVPFEQWEVQPC